MNSDTVINIMSNLNIDDVMNICILDKNYLKICNSPDFWYQYFKKHNKIIAYTPTNLKGWFLLYKNNDYVPILQYFDIDADDIRNIIEIIDNMYVCIFDYLNNLHNKHTHFVLLSKNSNFTYFVHSKILILMVIILITLVML